MSIVFDQFLYFVLLFWQKFLFSLIILFSVWNGIFQETILYSLTEKEVKIPCFSVTSQIVKTGGTVRLPRPTLFFKFCFNFNLVNRVIRFFCISGVNLWSKFSRELSKNLKDIVILANTFTQYMHWWQYLFNFFKYII